MDVGEIALKLGLDAKGLPKSINKAGKLGANLAPKAFSGMFGKLSLGLTGIFAGVKLGGFISDSIKLSSSLTEIQNVVDTTFKSNAGAVNDFAKSAKSNFGMSELSAKAFASELGATFKTARIGSEDLVDMSLGLTGLIGDISSFRNLDFEETFIKIKSGMVGETEAVRSLGVSIDVASMNAFLLSKGVKTNITSMSQAEKMTWRYKAIIEQSSDSIGDFKKTELSWANQTRLLSESFKELKTSLGASFINILTPILGVLNNILSRAMLVAEAFRTWTISIFGDATLLASDSAGVLSDNISTATDNTTALGKAAKKSVAGFDQLNTLSFGVSSGTGGTSTTSTKPKTNDTKVSSDTLNALNNIKDVIGDISSFTFPALEYVYTSILKPIGDWATQTLKPVFLEAFNKSLAAIASIMTTLKPSIDLFVQNFLVPVGGWIVTDLLTSISDGLTNLSTWIKGDGQWFVGFVGTLASLAAGFLLVKGAVNLVYFALGLFGILLNGATAGITLLATPAGAFLALAVALVAVMIQWKIHGENCKGTWNALGYIIEATLINIRQGFKLWIMGLDKDFAEFGTNVTVFWTGVVDTLKAAITNIGVFVSEQFKSVLSGITNLINGAIGGVNKLLTGLNNVAGTDFKPLQLLVTPGNTSSKSNSYTGIGPKQNSGSTELAYKLDKLNETVKANTKNIVLNVSGTELAKTVVSGIGNNQRRYGSSNLAW